MTSEPVRRIVHWYEPFFDLVFVVAVAVRLIEVDTSVSTVALFVLLLFPLGLCLDGLPSVRFLRGAWSRICLPLARTNWTVRYPRSRVLPVGALAAWAAIALVAFALVALDLVSLRMGRTAASHTLNSDVVPNPPQAT